MVEQKRPWMILRKPDTSKTVTASSSSAWNTAISLASITDFNRFYGDYPVRVFDGSNGIDYYSQVPQEERLRFKDSSGRFVYAESSQSLYLMGSIVRSGTLWLNHIRDSGELDDDDASEWVFPSWSHPLLGFIAVGLYKG